MREILERWVRSHADLAEQQFYYVINPDVPMEVNGTAIFYEMPINGKLVCAVHPEDLDEVTAICRENRIRMVRITLGKVSVTDQRDPLAPRHRRKDKLSDAQERLLLDVMSGYPLVRSKPCYLVLGSSTKSVNSYTVAKLIQLRYLSAAGHYLVPSEKAWQHFGHLVPQLPIHVIRRAARRMVRLLTHRISTFSIHR